MHVRQLLMFTLHTAILNIERFFYDIACHRVDTTGKGMKSTYKNFQFVSFIMGIDRAKTLIFIAIRLLRWTDHLRSRLCIYEWKYDEIR